jgi:hypothetical protein
LIFWPKHMVQASRRALPQETVPVTVFFDDDGGSVTLSALHITAVEKLERIGGHA